METIFQYIIPRGTDMTYDLIKTDGSIETKLQVLRLPWRNVHIVRDYVDQISHYSPR